MYGLILAAGIGYYLFVYQGIERTGSLEQKNQTEVRYPKSAEDAIREYRRVRLPWNEDIGEMFVYSHRFPRNILPEIKTRKQLFKQFESEVNSLRLSGQVSNRRVRFIDKVDRSLDLTTVKSVTRNDAVEKYKRQMEYLSLFTKDPNPFPLLRDRITETSIYSRPGNESYYQAIDYAGTFPKFLQDYYFSLYLPSQNEWQLYVMKQRRALHEIEKDVFSFLGTDTTASDTQNVTITLFSTVGLELMADILRPNRTVTPQLERYQQAFDAGVWKEYFPYTWAMVNRKDALKELKGWTQMLQAEEKEN